MLVPKKYKVSIFNETYSLISDEPETHIYESAELVNKLLYEAIEAHPLSSMHHNLVLIALKLASSSIKLDLETTCNKKNQEKLRDFINQELSL